MYKFKAILTGIALALMSTTTSYAYENIMPVDAYDAVTLDGAYILDVRTDAEFIWVGHPNIENVINISYMIEKKGAFVVNPSFISDINEIFGSAKNTQIITMCRSGKRSVAAAEALEAEGFANIKNMLTGFEGGEKDQYGYRTISGWKNSGLPGHTTKIGADDYYND